MHELAITESILNIAETHARQSGAARVTAINLVIGRLSSVVDDSVQFYWDFVSENSVCKGAKLNFTRLPARLHCQDCGTDFTMDGQLTVCPHCQSAHLKIVSGEEFYVESIEIETFEETSV